MTLYLSQWQEIWHWFDSAKLPFSANLLQAWLPFWPLLDAAKDYEELWWHRIQLPPQETQVISQELGCLRIWRLIANLVWKLREKWFNSGKLLLVTPSHSLSTKLPHLTGENLSNCRGRFKVTSWLKPNNPTLSPKKITNSYFFKISHGMKIVTCDEISCVKCQLRIVLSLHHWSYSGLLQEYQPFEGNSWLHGGWHLSWKVDAPSWQLGPQPPKENHKMVSQSTLIVYAKLTKLTRHNKHSSHLSFSG